VLVTGANSTWINRGNLHVGVPDWTYGATAFINGGSVISSNLYIGEGTWGASNGVVTLNGGALTVANDEENGQLDISGGTLTLAAMEFP